MNQEPSVLDYVKARLTPWRGSPPVSPLEGEREPGDRAAVVEMQPESRAVVEREGLGVPHLAPSQAAQTTAIPWRALAALFLAIAAQLVLEPPGRSASTGIIFYLIAFAWLVWAFVTGEWRSDPAPAAAVSPPTAGRQFTAQVRWPDLLVAIPLILAAFLAFGGNRFNSFNLLLWLLALVFTVRAFRPASGPVWTVLRRWAESLRRPRWALDFTPWSLLLAGVIAVTVFFRVYRLAEVPPEMFSDHAEKLLDVWDVLSGQYSIFFPRNTGREAFQFYLTAAVAELFGTGISFLSLKIGTVLAGLLTLVYLYLLGKEIGGRQVGLLALAFAGIAYWPNVISRVALRFTLYPFFVAPTLYFLIRGIRRSSLSDFILAGLFLGLGLHGYSPFRIVPFVVVAAVGIYLIHRESAGVRRQSLWALAVLALVALVVFLPLLRYAADNPEMFGYRAFTRLGSVERPLPGPAWQIFFSNLWNALLMFGLDDGNIWPVSVTNRPALDFVSAGLFHLGVGLLLLRYLRSRSWLDLFLLVSIPLLLLPSVLSLAFPEENPALNRAAGALVPTFLIVAIALDGLLNSLRSRLGGSRGLIAAAGVGGLLFTLAAAQNYGLVFNQYQNNFKLSSWNTSEMGAAIRGFANLTGSAESAWVVAYPHWVDTRLVGINAGYPTRDFAIWPDQLASTLADPRAKLFLVKPEDASTLEALRQYYPSGTLQEYSSEVENHNFLMYFVPPLE